MIYLQELFLLQVIGTRLIDNWRSRRQKWVQSTLDITSTRYSESLYIVNIFQKTDSLLHKPLSI